MKRALTAIFLVLTAICVFADLQLTVEVDYPQSINLQIPAKEDSDFSLKTSFGDGEFFNATGHVGRITGSGNDRTYPISLGYEYKLTNGSGFYYGGATGSAISPFMNTNVYSMNIISSLYDANPTFTVSEVPPSISPATRLKNAIWLTNVVATTNSPVDGAYRKNNGLGK
jgi:hypothetical protein